jgi:hypothetical protein
LLARLQGLLPPLLPQLIVTLNRAFHESLSGRIHEWKQLLRAPDGRLVLDEDDKAARRTTSNLAAMTAAAGAIFAALREAQALAEGDTDPATLDTRLRALAGRVGIDLDDLNPE